ncbi:FecR domain-containing protein [Paremcibacter congregatus]|uniref:Iron dicitrate transport regulator FecR n=1 Tax=Paremcibacter congregatus TaxID=2043170 RepID=A0A2G4YQ68_9PROT|nr:FecR domain-containing protein [Paremcibacter congregatus]PHZ84420.1 hypothetical protein CRD36_11435 [Paremcibacter congregatus]QDE28638.1 DUF4880 domain-containing protein [Paremcibacter congregatus]
MYNTSEFEQAKKRAFEWHVLLESNEATSQNREEFQAWLARNPHHRDIYDDILGLSHDFDILSGVYKAVPETLPDELSHLIEARGKPLENKTSAFYRKAVTLAAALLLSFILVKGGALLVETPDNYYTTDYNNSRSIRLSDGSEVLLNTDTELVVNFSDARRHVRLNRGEAYFNVAKDPDRPFVVTTQKGDVRAVGTAFNINQRTAVVEITVLEGIVQVNPFEMDSERAVAPRSELVIGQHMRLDSSSNPVEVMDEEHLLKTTGWKRGNLFFDGMKLSEIVAELNHYTSSKIIIVDAAVGNIEGGGIFNTKQVDTYLEALEAALPIKVVQVTPLLTLIFEKTI